MQAHNIDYVPCKEMGTVCYVACDNTFRGAVVISDIIKSEAKAAIDAMKAAGVKRTVMLTGDRKLVGESVAAELGLDKVYTDLLPADKVTKVEELLEQQSETGKLAFVGDGINDTPVLARSDIGFAMGGIGSDAAIEAADIVIMDDDIRKIAKTKRISKYTLRIIKQNITLALVVKLGIIVLSILGIANMWIAVFGDVGVAIVCILNAMRILSKRKKY